MAQSFEPDDVNAVDKAEREQNATLNPADLVFVGFNKRVCALNRDTGELVWSWKSPDGSGYVVLLYDSDRLIASVQGYTYCLDPATGEQMWSNPLKGMGLGVPCLASISGVSSTGIQAMAALETQQQQHHSST